ncbi:MAG TPA: enoyl-CoA hydratase-related protein [Candidatus Margulisiibacteriota bacterium]|nr:enoyl-CoA hydratase-related protein [Candidatus Margulisiibacteriota bacterium]
MDDTNELLTERRGGVGILRLNRPERRNALSPQLLFRLHEALDTWAQDDEIRTVVITGAGDKAFSSGYDILAIPTDVTPEMAQRLRDSNPLELALASVKNFPYPTIAMVNGHCFGGAVHLALCCDIRIGADDIAVGMPAARLGVVYPCDGIAQFVQMLGMARAREVFFTARTYRGPAVQAMGLVDRLVPRSELQPTTYALAEEIASNAPLALKGIKRTLNLIAASALLSAEARRECEALMAAAFQSEDIKEGQLAFIEKRPPHFVGR